MNGDRFTNPIVNDSVIHSFDTERSNIGNAMNLSTGVFTASKPGIYHFSASFVKVDGTRFLQVVIQPSPLHILIRLNRKSIAETIVKSGYSGSQTSVQATLKVKKGDRIDLFKRSKELAVHNCTHSFTGWLVDEDLE